MLLLAGRHTLFQLGRATNCLCSVLFPAAGAGSAKKCVACSANINLDLWRSEPTPAWISAPPHLRHAPALRQKADRRLLRKPSATDPCPSPKLFLATSGHFSPILVHCWNVHFLGWCEFLCAEVVWTVRPGHFVNVRELGVLFLDPLVRNAAESRGMTSDLEPNGTSENFIAVSLYYRGLCPHFVLCTISPSAK